MQKAHTHNARTKKRDDVTGVILAGGRSSRMGRDKATLEVGGTPLFERVLAVLQGFFADVLIAGDRPDLARPTVPYHPDLYPGSALGGLYTGLLKARTDWIFVAPCDMPHPDPELIRVLLERREGYPIVVPRTGAGFEPLFALYHKDCLEPMLAMLEERNYRVYDLYDRMSVRYVEESEMPPDWERSLININTPEEYSEIRKKS